MGYRRDLEMEAAIPPILGWPLTLLLGLAALIFLLNGGFLAAALALAAAAMFLPPLWARADMTGAPILLRIAVAVALTMVALLFRPSFAGPTCYEKGVDYFKEIGSYPQLSDGRDAKNEAWRRCQISERSFS